MRLLKRLLARLRNLASRQSDDQRFLEEMEGHLSRLTEENVRSGMTLSEARRQAVLKFGAVEAIREQYHAEKSLPFLPKPQYTAILGWGTRPYGTAPRASLRS